MIKSEVSLRMTRLKFILPMGALGPRTVTLGLAWLRSALSRPPKATQLLQLQLPLVQPFSPQRPKPSQPNGRALSRVLEIPRFFTWDGNTQPFHRSFYPFVAFTLLCVRAARSTATFKRVTNTRCCRPSRHPAADETLATDTKLSLDLALCSRRGTRATCSIEKTFRRAELA
jgi:hypothetical protein